MKYKINELQQKHGDLHEVIPNLVNRYGQYPTAKQLGVSVHTINRWLKENGWQREVKYVRRDEQPKGAA
jgi:DNA invertase Pin-like site-specific DNA recombinase